MSDPKAWRLEFDNLAVTERKDSRTDPPGYDAQVAKELVRLALTGANHLLARFVGIVINVRLATASPPAPPGVLF